MKHDEVVRRFEDRTILLGVDRPGAGKFYTQLGLEKIRELTGEAPYVETMIVWGSYLLAPLFLVGSLVLAAVALHWWTVIAAPLTLLLFLYWWTSSPLANRHSRWSALLLVAAIASVFTSAGLFFKLWLISAAASLFLIRFTYAAATFLLRCFVVRNSRAYDLWVKQGIVVVREAQ